MLLLLLSVVVVCCVVSSFLCLLVNIANAARPFGTTAYGMVINSVAFIAEDDRSNLGLAESCVENTGFFNRCWPKKRRSAAQRTMTY